MTSTIQNNRTRLSTTDVYDKLKEDILKGVLPPNKKLILKNLSTQYSAGNSPLREALTQLSYVGMVVKTEGRGFSVAPAGIAELRELTQTRCLIAEVALRDSIANGDAEWEDRVVVAFHRLQKAALSKAEQDLNTSSEWESNHRKFHTALISACNSTLLSDFAEQLQMRAERFRNLSDVVNYRDQFEHEEHRSIKNAVLDRNIELAVKLIKQHYSAALEVIERQRSLTNEMIASE